MTEVADYKWFKTELLPTKVLFWFTYLQNQKSLFLVVFLFQNISLKQFSEASRSTLTCPKPQYKKYGYKCNVTSVNLWNRVISLHHLLVASMIKVVSSHRFYVHHQHFQWGSNTRRWELRQDCRHPLWRPIHPKLSNEVFIPSIGRSVNSHSNRSWKSFCFDSFTNWAQSLDDTT